MVTALLSFLISISCHMGQTLDSSLFPYNFDDTRGKGLLFQPAFRHTYATAAAVFSSALLTLLLLYGPEIENFMYLTYWGFTAVVGYFFLRALELSLYRAYGGGQCSWMWKLSHYTFSDIFILIVVINCVYWFGFFPYLATHRKPDQPLGWLDILQAIGAHFVPLCLAVIEMLDNAVGYWNWRRVWPIIIMMVGYLFINAVWTISTICRYVEVSPVYPVLTFTDWVSYVFIVGMVALVLFVYYILILFTRFYKKHRLEKLLGRSLAPIDDNSKISLDGPSQNMQRQIAGVSCQSNGAALNQEIQT